MKVPTPRSIADLAELYRTMPTEVEPATPKEPYTVKATAVFDTETRVSETLVGRSADLINHPPHYTGHPSGVECITVTEHMNFCLGNAMKYIWRAGSKGDAIADLKKARWYIDREIARLSPAEPTPGPR